MAQYLKVHVVQVAVACDPLPVQKGPPPEPALVELLQTVVAQRLLRVFQGCFALQNESTQNYVRQWKIFCVTVY
eukprot:scaffold25126_cov21-Prasinocladus_malaysianus.AAC.1